MLIGHQSQIEAFTAAFTGGRPHHAWLLVGQQGLGKASFTREAATWLLAGAPRGDGFAVPPEGDAARLMAAGSHLDYRLIERTEAKTGKLRSEIVIGQIVRRTDSEGQPLREFLSGTPMLGARRVVVIDAADDMNRNTANALLKSLEEPSEDTVFLLVSHSPGRLLPTIRYDVKFESDRIRDAGFAGFHRIRESATIDENTLPLAEFLDIPVDKAREIAATGHLFVD